MLSQNAGATNSGDKSIIFTETAPAPLGAYSQGVKIGNLVFLAAQTPVVPETNQVAEGEFEGQLRQTFKNLKAMVVASGGEMSNVAQVTVYITDISKFGIMNSIMEEFFQKPFPARTTVGAKELARNTMVAIDAIMVL